MAQSTPLPRASAPAAWQGIALAILLALVAEGLGRFVPLIGGPIFGMILGFAAAQAGAGIAFAKPGMSWSGKKLLRYGIVCLGAGMSLGQVWQVGADSFWVMIVSLAAALVAAWLLGKLLGVPSRLTALLGVGTGICGASAIAAAAPIIGAVEQEIAYGVATIFAFNMAAVVLFPIIGHALDFSQHAFGLWAGTAINDTSSVVAAGFSYGADAGAYATVVKLTRATMIVPITLVMAGWIAWRSRKSKHVNWRTTIPWFIGGFVLVAAIRSTGLIPDNLAGWISDLGRFLLVVALVGVGFGANFKQLKKTGVKPLVLGLLLWAVVALTSLGMQSLTGA